MGFWCFQFSFVRGESDEKMVEENFAASYINFYIGNSVLLIPAFNQQTDKIALSLVSAPKFNEKV